MEHYKAFNEKWFKKHQRVLLFLLNAPIIKVWFRWVMRIRKIDHPLNEVIYGIFPNRFLKKVEYKDKKFFITADFRTHDKFSKRMYYAFKPFWWMLHYWDEVFADKFAPNFSFGFTTLTAYPASGSGAPCSGYVRRNGVNESLTTIRAGAGTTAYGYDDFISFYLETDVSNTSNNFYANYRALVGFDTSSIGSSATISSATNSLYGGSAYNEFATANPDYYTVDGTPNSESAFSTADYAQARYGATSFGSIANGGWSSGVYNDISLNASGIASINKTGNSFFGWLTSWDFNNSFTGTWAVTKRGGINNARGVNQAGDSTDPKLVVVYSTTSISSIDGILIASVKTSKGLSISSVKNINGLA